MIMRKVFKRILTIPLEIELFVSKQCRNYGNRVKLWKNSPVMFVFLKSREPGDVSWNIYIVLGLELNFRNLATSLFCPLTLRATRKQAWSRYS